MLIFPFSAANSRPLGEISSQLWPRKPAAISAPAPGLRSKVASGSVTSAAASLGMVADPVSVEQLVGVSGGLQHGAVDAHDDVTGAYPGLGRARVGHHPAHTARAWRAVLDLLDETVGTLAATS